MIPLPTQLSTKHQPVFFFFLHRAIDLASLPYMTTTTITTIITAAVSVAATTSTWEREERQGEREINPTTNQLVSPVLESKSIARNRWSQDHMSASWFIEAGKVSTPMSKAEFIIFPPIFTLYFISLHAVTL